MMENILNYYYQIIISSDKIKNNGYFSYHNHLFCLYKYERNKNEINALSYLNELMILNKISVNKIIYNIFNQAITYIDNQNYVLIMINYEYRGYDNLKFIPIIEDRRLNILKRNNWAYLWEIKIDYVEYQLKHIINSFPIINQTINYYIGMTENAIRYFKMLDLKDVPLYINHRRIKKNELYNPLELIIDYKVRDIAEYLKNSFFNNEMSIGDIKEYTIKLELNNLDYLLLYVRLLYPSYYFDIYDNIINNNLNEDAINKVINKSSLYEELLYEIYLLIRGKTNIIGIDWINKKYQ